jgi:uncharacterized GH25 family protein
MRSMTVALTAALTFCCVTVASAHDLWVQTNTPVVRVGDSVIVDVMLGNHGNDHRDFKLAGKADRATVTLTLVNPAGETTNLTPKLADLGLGPKEGYLSTRATATTPGFHSLILTSDKVVSYAPTRSIKSAKTFFIAAKRLDQPLPKQGAFDKPAGHPFEIVAVENPVAMASAGKAIVVRVLWQGKPAAGQRVSFIPRGVPLSEGFDSRYERTTDESGLARFEPSEGNVYLIVAHRESPEEKGEGYTSAKYSATLTVHVPDICGCCGE